MVHLLLRFQQHQPALKRPSPYTVVDAVLLLATLSGAWPYGQKRPDN